MNGVYRNINLKILLNNNLTADELKIYKISEYLTIYCKNLKKYKSVTYDTVFYGKSKNKIFFEWDNDNQILYISIKIINSFLKNIQSFNKAEIYNSIQLHILKIIKIKLKCLPTLEFTEKLYDNVPDDLELVNI